jgi:hypothetical protein
MLFKAVNRDRLANHGKVSGYDSWMLKRNEPLRLIKGISLRAGRAEIHKASHSNNSYFDKLSLGKVRNTADDPAASWCINGQQDLHLRTDASRVDLPEEYRWHAIQLAHDSELVVEEGDKIRLLAFSGTNKRMGGEDNPWRGGFMFGGARLRKVKEDPFRFQE